MSGFCFLTTIVAAFLGIVGRHDRPDSAFLELGARFEAVGRVLPDGDCTLVAPTWVLTAAHVAGQSPVEKLRVRFGDQELRVKRVVLHPDAQVVPGRPPEVDLGLMELERPVSGIEPVQLYRQADEPGRTVILAGHGDTGNGTDPPKKTDGKRRAAMNAVTDAGPRRLFFVFDKPPAGLDLEGVSGPGDSGGPALIEVEGKIHIAGVSSAAMDGKPGRYGVTEVYTRVSSYVAWIQEVTGITPDGT